MKKSPKLSLKIKKNSFSSPLFFNETADKTHPKALAQIDDQIFIGSYEDASNYEKLKESNITDIINCSPFNCPNTFKDNFQYFNFELCDSPNFELWDPLNSIINLIKKLKAKGRKVLIHCYQGISRAPSIAIGYLITCEDRNFEEAIKMVKSNYIKADPNIGFILQLEEFYKELHGIESR